VNKDISRIQKPDPEEPEKIADLVAKLDLNYVVITTVTRDDLEDGGANIWAKTIREVKKLNPVTSIEGLIPDFQGKKELIKIVLDAGAEVISHNLETVRRLTPQVRSAAQYDRSLEVIGQIAHSQSVAKSGIMVGLGEMEDEIFETMDDLLKVGCEVMTIGQYLQPTKNHLPVNEYIHPDVFKKWEEIGLIKGFKFVESAPLVRSSYHAEKHAGRS